jgi:hypothetical protein
MAFFDPFIPLADSSFPSANRAPYIPPIPNPLNWVPHSVHPELSPSTLIALQDYGGLPLALVVAPRASVPQFHLDIPGPPTSSSSPNRALFLPISSSSPSRALFPLASSSRPQRLLFSDATVIGCWRWLLPLVQVSLNSTLISLAPPTSSSSPNRVLFPLTSSSCPQCSLLSETTAIGVIAFSTLSFNLLFKSFYCFICSLFRTRFPHGHSFFMYFSIFSFGYLYSHD